MEYKNQNNMDSDDDFNKLNNLTIIDNELYLNLIKKYNMVEIPNLFFIKFNYINVFEFEIDIKSYNQYLNLENKSIHDILLTKNITIEKLEFNYPKKVKPKHILKSNYEHFKTFLLDYIKYLEKKIILNIKENNISNQDNISNKDNISNQDNISNKDNISNFSNIECYGIKNNQEIIYFAIPILWNGCDKILKKFKKQELDKKLILEHWNNCKKCEIINNNSNKLEIDGTKIVIKKNIKFGNDFLIMDKIIDDYKNIRKFSCPRLNSEFENNKTNIICCDESNSIYNNCFFVLYE